VALVAEKNVSAVSELLPRLRSRNIAVDVLWRFLLLYVFLSNWIWVDELIINPTRPIRPVFNAVFGGLARWTGYHIFHLTGTLAPNSFRDTRYLYLLLLVLAVVSFVGAVMWTILRRDGRSAQTAYKWLRVWIRYSLAYMILIYAMQKVFRLQFPFPSLQRLIEPYGESSPMALLWTYVGYSGFVTVFSGLAEAAGAVLLLFRRTAPLGALVSVVMMANVAMMDFCYDVSVKMLAAHFLAMGVFLLAHDAERLLGVLAFNRTAPARDLANEALPVSNPRIRRFLPLVKALVVLYVVVPVTVRTWKDFLKTGPFIAHVPFYGVYRVASFSADGQERPLLETDKTLWRYVIIERPSEVTIKKMDDSLTVLKSKYDSASPHLDVQSSEAQSNEAGAGKSGSPQTSLSITPSQHGELLLTGEAGSSHVTAVLEPIDPQSFTLVNRGFHWINEKSFDR
jgi:hypothetical protein